MSRPNIEYLRAEGDKFIFLMDQPWSSGGYQDMLRRIYDYETFLEEIGAEWYYGGNRYLDRSQPNHGLVVRGMSAATALRLFL